MSTDSEQPGLERYHLGTPLWGYEGWRGSLYTTKARPAEFLEQFASVFNAVEGNTTFYHLPSAETVMRWRAATPESFRFAFKLPRAVTHERLLFDFAATTREFLQRLEPLGPRRGPFMVQLPAAFGPEDLERLDAFLTSWPQDLEVAVEVRHREFFRAGDAADRLRDLLRHHDAERVILDTRAYFAGDPDHPAVRSARHPKPNLPVWTEVAGSRPLVRFITHPDTAATEPWLDHWGRRLASWIEQGRRPSIFVHCPGDDPVPFYAADLHDRVASQIGVGRLPRFPGRGGRAGEQLSLL